MGGLEPPTSGLAGRCSIQLSYMATSPPNTGNRESSGEPLGYTVIPLPPTKLRSRIGTLPTTATEQDEPPSRGVEPPPLGPASAGRSLTPRTGAALDANGKGTRSTTSSRSTGAAIRGRIRPPAVPGSPAAQRDFGTGGRLHRRDPLRGGQPPDRVCRPRNPSPGRHRRGGEPETRPAAPDAEQRERGELRSRASLGRYLVNALRGRAATGAEAELQEAAGSGDGIPLELWDVPTETRADAATGALGPWA